MAGKYMIIGLMALVLVYGCANPNNTNNIYDQNNSAVDKPNGANTSPAIAISIAEANNWFAFDLYTKYSTTEGNIFFSPYSISSALAMTYEGARGKTAEEIKKVFYLPSDNERRNGYEALNSEINKEGKKYKLSIANALWVQQDYRLLDAYTTNVEQYYGGKVTNMNFVKNAEGSRKEINDWVEDHTNNKIKDLIPVGMIDAATKLVLTNAIYFKGEWAKQFEKSKTSEKDFVVSKDNIVKVQMMKKTDEDAKFPYFEDEVLQMLELPYSGNDLSMLIILPKEELAAIEKQLTLDSLEEWKSHLKEDRVDIFVPRFKFETKYLMAEDLAEMGMPSAFSNADFSGITGKMDLVISQVIHQAYIEVNEEGTEAAAATAIVMKATSMPLAVPVFRADHPFIFIIQQKDSGNILFMGRVSEPT